MRIDIGLPQGIAPKLDPRLLGNSQAQVARNLRFTGQAWESYWAPTKVANFSGAFPRRTIFRYDDSMPIAQGWFDWQSDVDVIRSPLYPNQAVLFTENGTLKITDATTAFASSPYPAGSYSFSLPGPTAAPVLAAGGTIPPGSVSGANQSIAVVYTFVDASGRESRPSPPASISIGTLDSVAMSGMEVPSGAISFAGKRIYSSVSGARGFYLRGEVLSGQTTFNFPYARALNNNPGASATQDQLVTENLFPWPTDLHSIALVPGNFLVGISGDSLVFSEPGYLYGQNPNYSIKTPVRPIGLKVFGNTIVVGTKGRQYLYQGLGPESMQEIKGDKVFACVSKRSMMDLDGNAVGYVSPDGFVVVSAQGSNLVTAAHFTSKEWAAFAPASMHGVFWNNMVVLFYDNGTTQGGIVLSEQFGPQLIDVYAHAAYVDTVTNAMYLAMADGIYLYDAGAPQTWTWRSKRYAQPRKTSFAAMQVRSDGPVTVKGIADGRLQWTRVVNNEIVSVGAGYRGEEWEFEFSSPHRMATFSIAESYAELTVV